MLWQIFRADNCLCMLLGHISLFYKQLLQYTLLKYFTVPPALLTRFPKKFHMKLLTSDIIFTKLSTKHFCFDDAVFHLSIKGYCKTRPHRSYCFLSMIKLRCKRHYRNLATYSWCTTWREHVTKTAPARRRHSVGGAAAAAHISKMKRPKRKLLKNRVNTCRNTIHSRLPVLCYNSVYKRPVSNGIWKTKCPNLTVVNKSLNVKNVNTILSSDKESGDTWY